MNDTQKTAPEYSALRWAILAAICLAITSFQLVSMSYAPLLGEIAKDLSVDLPTAVQLMTYFMFFSSISFFVGGPFVDKFGPAASIVVSVLLAFLPTLATVWLGHSYNTVVVIRILQGFAVGFCMGGMVPMIMQWFPAKQRAFALGITGAFNPLGAMLAVTVTPAAFTAFGDWRAAMGVVAIIPFAVLVYCLAIFAYSRGKAPQMMGGAPDGSADGDVFKKAMASPLTWLGITAAFGSMWLLQTAFSITPSYFAEPSPAGIGLGPVVGGQLTTFLQIASIIAPILGGFAAGRFFNGRPGGIIFLGFILAFTYGALQFSGVYDNQALLTLFLILPGLGIGMLVPMLQAKIAESYDPSVVGRMNGLWIGIGSFGGTAGLFISAKSLATTGTYVTSINILAIVAIICAVLVLVMNRIQKRPAVQPVVKPEVDLNTA
ncbi:MFS transporter [Cohaesibacter celericrescens]|uniref:Major facilitator superfamily (MFS) profile domain-containing protein n=1 Tax=Cohaesibacter celericrescens TaxID=2067669 RepID=A0A2N5XRG8_9HYPH|nr:MFS transporter [Cohaesibacter celericrescens]PLW77112.1 hypothetical protein C0081_11195 [Cohaesibacter celericrescens]